MKVCVVGLWHLGCVTAACLASAGHDVVGVDDNAGTIATLSAGVAPIREPGLDDLIKDGIARGLLRFATDAAAIADADVVWITFDTPVDADDVADVDSVIDAVVRMFPFLRDGTSVLVSAQLPVGTTRRLEESFAALSTGRHVSFGYSPENLRLGRAIDAFNKPDRIVVGVRHAADREKIATLLSPLSAPIEWMSVESAEMTKHALNAFLATSISFINEIAAICEVTGADASEVERGLKSERRIGPHSYLSAGAAFAGGTLARDVVYLAGLGQGRSVPTHLLSAVKTSNDLHREWAQRRLDRLLGTFSGKTVAVWGLTYKPATSTLRRSSAVEVCRWLADRGAQVRVHDPSVSEMPDELAGRVVLASSPLDAVTEASALIVATPWPEYRLVSGADVRARMARHLVLDPIRFTEKTQGAEPGVEFVSVGRGGA
jgi:UDPglucose 6-dehydrogenase